MKLLTFTATALLLATSAHADKITAYVQDNYVTVTESVPYTTKQCQNVQVPIYGTVTRQGSANGGDVLGGMILGGLLGKGVTGKDNGAAAGAVLGGIIAADNANKPKTETVITGYKTERQCENVTEYRNEYKKVYDYSTLTFTVDGVEYETTFVK